MSEKFILDPRFTQTMKKISKAMRPWSWCLIGGRAVEVWANPPQTPDIDILTTITDDDVDAAIKAFDRVDVELESFDEGFGGPMLFFKDKKTQVEVDVLGAFEPLHYFIVDRAPTKVIRGFSFPVAYAEDIVILKSRSAADPGRPIAKKSRDRKAIFDINAQVVLDKAYISQTLFDHRWREEISLLKLMRILK